MNLLCAYLALTAPPQTDVSPLPLIPVPAEFSAIHRGFTLTPAVSIVATGDARTVADRLGEYLRPATGYKFPVVNRSATAAIRLTLEKDAKLGREGYSFESSAKGIAIRATTTTGLFYGVQTLRQLLPAEIFQAKKQQITWSVPGVQIRDYPRFGWRGLMIDSGRHFFPKSEILKFIDVMALHKMNSLHLHLTEDQGWRIEIKKYPKLTEIGSRRKESMLGPYSDHKFDGKPYGGFYTQADLREIVAYAAKNHITVMPEIEAPGHCQSALAAYPELGNTGKRLEVRTQWGVNENVYNVEDSTIHFIEDVLTEVMAIFPSKFIHIGGDEVPKTQWKNSPRAQELKTARGLKTEEELQSWFIRQLDAFLVKHGRRLVGWDEILEGGLAPSATVMSWRGEKGGIAAAKAGHDVVMAPNAYTYLDHYQSKDQKSEPLAIGGFLPLEKVYGYEPIPAGLTPEQAKHVLGAQGQLWSEYIDVPSKLEYMAFPRACALAEAVWRQPGPKDFANFRARLETDLIRLATLGVNFRKLD